MPKEQEQVCGCGGRYIAPEPLLPLVPIHDSEKANDDHALAPAIVEALFGEEVADDREEAGR